MNRSLQIVAVLLLAGPGCMSLQVDSPEIVHYDLRAAPPAAAESADGPLSSLRVEPFGADSSRDRHEFVWRNDGSAKLGYNAYHRWSRRPSSVAWEGLLDTLQARSPDGDAPGLAAEPDLVFNGRVSAFEQVFSGPSTQGPSKVRVVLTGTLRSTARQLEAGSRRLEARGEQDVSGTDLSGDRSGVASAMSAALRQALDRLADQLQQQASTFGPRPLEPERTGNRVLIDLLPRNETETTLRPDLAVRVSRVRAAGGLDQLEVLRRVTRHRVDSHPDLRWQRRPTEMVESALVASLRAAGAQASRPTQDGASDLRVEALLHHFEIDGVGGSARARVVLEVALDGSVEKLEGSGAIDPGQMDGVAQAFEDALTQVASRVPVLVAAASLPVAAADISEQPDRRLLVVEPGPLPRVSRPLPASVRVLRLGAKPHLDRVEVLQILGDTTMEVRTEHHWRRRPSQRVTDALIEVLTGTGAFRAVEGAFSAQPPEYEIRGEVLSYQLRRTGELLEAEVSLRLSLTAVRSTGEEDSVRHLIEAQGSAPVGRDDADGIARAMSKALAITLGDALKKLTARAHEMAAGS